MHQKMFMQKLPGFFCMLRNSELLIQEQMRLCNFYRRALFHYTMTKQREVHIGQCNAEMLGLSFWVFQSTLQMWIFRPNVRLRTSLSIDKKQLSDNAMMDPGMIFHQNIFVLRGTSVSLPRKKELLIFIGFITRPYVTIPTEHQVLLRRKSFHVNRCMSIWRLCPSQATMLITN